MMAKKKGKVSSPKYDPKEEEASRKRHPTAGGKSSIDPQATIYITAAEIPVDIEATWARALTDETLVENFHRYIQEPTGWKKAQKWALLAEVLRRLDVKTTFMYLTRQHIRDFRLALNNRENGDVAALHCAQAIEREVDTYCPFATDRQQTAEV
jgi:hypothetical protein